MDIKIDQQSIDFSLENESTIGEVVSGIESWLGNSGLLIATLKADNKELRLEERGAWRKTPLESIEELDVSTEMSLEKDYSDLTTVFEYLSAFSTALKANDNNTVRELYKEHKPVLEYLYRLFGIDENNTESPLHQFKALLSSSGISEGKTQDKETISRLLHYVDTLSIIIMERIREISNPMEELERLITLLQKTNEEIKDVALLLQTGKDKEAMNLVIRFTELSQKLLRIIQILDQKNRIYSSSITVEGQTLQDFYKELNGFFHELREAFEIEDSVLIGDVFEYEIAPRVEKLIDSLHAVTEYANKEE